LRDLPPGQIGNIERDPKVLRIQMASADQQDEQCAIVRLSARLAEEQRAGPFAVLGPGRHEARHLAQIWPTVEHPPCRTLDRLPAADVGDGQLARGCGAPR
jgi:hypothetical protein